MILFKPRVGKVIFAQTTGGFAVIIPIYIYIYIYIKNEVLISNSATVKVTCTILFRPSV